MQMSTVSGITTRRTITDINLNSYNSSIVNQKSKAILTTKQNTSNIKTITVSSDRYARLDSTMPAIAFINFTTESGGLFLTNTIPPKYIKLFTCTRVNNDVGKFTLDLQCPIDTFNAGSDDLNLKLINLFGHIDAATTDDAGNASGFKCEISYGWRGSSANTIIKYDQAQILGMTLNYSGNYYTYSISGTVNNTPKKAHETGVKMLSIDALQSIDSTKFSDAAVNQIADTLSKDPTTSLNSTKNYKIVIPVGTTIYEKGSPPTATKYKTTMEYTKYIGPDSPKSNGWTKDYTFFYTPRNDHITDYYSVADVTIYEVNSNGKALKDDQVDVSSSVETVGLDLTTVKAGERISTKVEILANYIFGDLYEVDVCHNDKEFTEDVTSIATLVEGLSTRDVAPDDEPSYTINETTTSLYTWLLHMIRACQDNSQAEAYDKFKDYDFNNDGCISQGDLASVTSIDTQAIVDKWKKHNITSAFTTLMSVKDFNSKYKDYVYLNAPYSTEYLQPQNFIGPTRDFISPVQSPYSTVSRTYSEYEADYNVYQTAKNYTGDSAELNDLLDNYDGIIYKKAEAIQYHLYYMEAVAGKKGKIYIGPARTDAEAHQYVVGNNAKDSTVISFSTSENMVYLISAVKSYVSAAKSGLYKIDVTTGAIIPGNVDTSSEQITNKEEYAVTVANSILSTIAKGHIKAELTVLSDITSRKIQTTDNVTVLCQANGGKTMLSGTYYVADVNDTIDENGKLTTKMTLQFTQSSAFKAVKDTILQHLNTITI